MKKKKKSYLERLLERKPKLKLCSNHYKTGRRVLRWWDSKNLGTAIKDGDGWYVQKETRRR